MAKKNPSPSTSLDAALVDAAADKALEALTAAGDKAEALIDAWVKKPNAGAIAAVAASESPHRKSAKRAAAVLKSRGVKVAEVKPAPAPVAPVETTWSAWYLPPDPAGVCMLTIGSHSTGERWNVVDVRLHELAGILEVSPGEATGGSIRDAFKRTREARGMAPTPVPVEWARWRIADAKKKNARSGLVMPMGLDSALPLLEPVPENEPVSPIADITVDEAQIEPRAKVSGTLHNEPEFRGWLPDSPTMEQMLGKVGERLGADPSTLPPETVNKMFEEEMAAATDRFFTPDVRNVIAHRMKECAISVYARAGKERTIDVLATAEAAKRAGLITSPPSEIPFLKAFFQKGLALMAQSSGGRISIPVPAGAQPPAAPAQGGTPGPEGANP